jgi:hypothetical protein
MNEIFRCGPAEIPDSLEDKFIQNLAHIKQTLFNIAVDICAIVGDIERGVAVPLLQCDGSSTAIAIIRSSICGRPVPRDRAGPRSRLDADCDRGRLSPSGPGDGFYIQEERSSRRTTADTDW